MKYTDSVPDSYRESSAGLSARLHTPHLSRKDERYPLDLQPPDQSDCTGQTEPEMRPPGYQRTDEAFRNVWYRSVEGRSQPVSLEGGSRIRQVGGSLYVGGALLRDSGRYVCVVNNSVGAERASTSLLVTTPLSAYMVPQQQTVDVGRSAQLNCSTEGYPQLAVSWLKDGQPLHTSSRVKLVSPQTLRIEHVERSDRGMYQCVVSNNEETAQGTAEIMLGDSSPVLVSAFSSATLQPGDTWSAQCEAAGSPLPSVSWLLDGQSLHSSAVPGERRVEVTVQAGGVSVTGRLSLSGLRTTDAGVYECVASNAVGEARHAAPLHVLGPPHVRPMRDARLVAREDATFHCRVTGYPISEVHWEREGKLSAGHS
ncbi:Down syndrome cell adhesion molecule-like protein Dscam2 [Schistocerca gregaria]|uniref:Down syndrome cell adhesion molecule-like protein Dscam2 n=1 Tax=Schistocerca gregaria TaxID=7010 RepID=UPI00211E7E57|nr:Down syndrome cell adhesion molecule-like protein Dscam2 [Schistocerca gregaria]